jgi:hypothetical protein
MLNHFAIFLCNTSNIFSSLSNITGTHMYTSGSCQKMLGGPAQRKSYIFIFWQPILALILHCFGLGRADHGPVLLQHRSAPAIGISIVHLFALSISCLLWIIILIMCANSMSTNFFVRIWMETPHTSVNFIIVFLEDFEWAGTQLNYPLEPCDSSS